jgi:uncharacterized protein YciI
VPHYLFRLQPTRSDMHATGPTQAEAEAIAAHFGYLQRLMERGAVLLAGRTTALDDAAFGLVLLQTDTESQAQALMQADPAVAQGVMRGELHPFRIALWSAKGPGVL